MLAAIFITGGINALRSPQGHVAAAKPVLDAVAPAVDKVIEATPIEERPNDELLVKIDAGVKIAAGTLLAFGRFPRLASTALAASLIPTTLAGHRFWEETDPEAKAQQQIQFLKNVGLLGGLLIAAADTHGEPSLGWRGRRAARLASAAVSAQATSISEAASDLTDKLTGSSSDVASTFGERAAGVAGDASGAVSNVAAGLVGLAPGAGVALTKAGSDLSSRASELSGEWTARAASAAKKAEKRGAKLQKVAGKRGKQLQKSAEKRSAVLQKQAQNRRAELEKRAAKRGAKLQKAAEKKWAELEKKAPGVLDQAADLGHDLVVRASAVGSEVAHQADGLAKDARKRVHAMTA